MIVPENKIVYLVTGWLAELELFGKLYNGLVFFAEFIVYAFCKPVVPAPAISAITPPVKPATKAVRPAIEKAIKALRTGKSSAPML